MKIKIATFFFFFIHYCSLLFQVSSLSRIRVENSFADCLNRRFHYCLPLDLKFIRRVRPFRCVSCARFPDTDRRGSNSKIHTQRTNKFSMNGEAYAALSCIFINRKLEKLKRKREQKKTIETAVNNVQPFPSIKLKRTSAIGHFSWKFFTNNETKEVKNVFKLKWHRNSRVLKFIHAKWWMLTSCNH